MELTLGLGLQGGSVVAEACNKVQAEVGDIAGLTVVDVVEGERD